MNKVQKKMNMKWNLNIKKLKNILLAKMHTTRQHDLTLTTPPIYIRQWHWTLDTILSFSMTLLVLKLATKSLLLISKANIS